MTPDLVAEGDQLTAYARNEASQVAAFYTRLVECGLSRALVARLTEQWMELRLEIIAHLDSIFDDVDGDDDAE